MKATATTRSFASRNALIFFPCALAITLFLFYTDEGAYSLSWDGLLREWPVLLGYVLCIFTAQFFLTFVMRHARPLVRIPLSLILGIPLGFLLLFGGGALFALVHLLV